MMSIATAALVALAALGMPLFIVLGAAALLASANAGLDPIILIVEMSRLASSPNLIAIPLFTLTGVVLANGGAPQRLVRLFDALFGWLPGGLAVVALSSCAFFTAFSGASGVTILALGGLLYPMLTGAGYSQRFSLGLLTSSGSLGLLFPPSLPILLYGIVAGVSIDQLFLSGLVPGLLLLMILSLYSVYTGRRVALPRSVFAWASLRAALRTSVWDLLLPLIILAGIFTGILTVTEAAAVSAAYVLILECCIQRTITLRRHLVPILKDTATLVGTILIILSIAMGLTNLLIDAQVPAKIFAVVQRTLESPLEFLLWLNVFLLVVGSMMDIFSAIIVVVPLILPLAQHYQIDPLQLGIIFLANLEIGYLTPPVGINLFMANQRFNVPIVSLFRATLPFLALMLVWLAIVTYVPEASLWWR